MPRSHEMDSGCGVVWGLGEKSPPIDTLDVGIGVSQMYRRTPASPTASRAFTTKLLGVMSDITFHGFSVGIFRFAPTSLTFSWGAPTASTCLQEQFFILWS
eukprot:6440337-Pyramimonas_sp.AAC.1